MKRFCFFSESQIFKAILLAIFSVPSQEPKQIEILWSSPDTSVPVRYYCLTIILEGKSIHVLVVARHKK